MARRPVHQDNDAPQISKAMERHISGLGCHNLPQYVDWCWANGFDGSLDKSRFDLQEERETFLAIVERKKKQERLHKHPKEFLEAVCCGELASDDIDRPNYKATAAEIEASNEAETYRQSLFEMLLDLIRYDSLIFQTVPDAQDTPFVRGLIKLHDRKALWLRPLADWKPRSKNPERMFGELAHYLFDKFGDVPRFMNAVWLRNDRASWRYRDWYVHVGRGHNLRTAKSPVPITKKIAHHFLKAPDNFSAEQAIRWGQLSALGADRGAIEAVVATRLGRSFDNEVFWGTVLRFVADNPMLDPRQIGPVIDYLYNQKYQPTEIEVAPGEWRQEPPPQPGLSMQGRSVATLMRQVSQWHDSLGKLGRVSAENYARANFEGFATERKSAGKGVFWAIRQLRSARDLQLESDELKHCVASYHWSCARGHCTIWSLSSSEDGKLYERRQTIEVDRNGQIVQCRGLANRDPTTEEWSIVTTWAREEGLQVASYF